MVPVPIRVQETKLIYVGQTKVEFSGREVECIENSNFVKDTNKIQKIEEYNEGKSSVVQNEQLKVLS